MTMTNHAWPEHLHTPPSIAGSPATLGAPRSESASAAPGVAHAVGTFAESSPLGLLCLAIACAALVPIAFGRALTPDALRTAAVFCLVFGGGGQLLAGLMALANKNLLGGTLFTTFSFNWVVNAWTFDGMAQGKMPSPAVGLAVDVVFLVIFVVLAAAFAYASKLLFVFLVDIVALYMLRIAGSVFATHAVALPIAVATVVLLAIALYLALATLLNHAAARTLLPLGGPLLGN